MSSRSCKPVTALCFNGAQPDASDSQQPDARLLLLSGPDLRRWILLQAAHQEHRVQESGRRGSHAGVCWRRGHQLHRGEKRSSSSRLDHTQSSPVLVFLLQLRIAYESYACVYYDFTVLSAGLGCRLWGSSSEDACGSPRVGYLSVWGQPEQLSGLSDREDAEGL